MSINKILSIVEDKTRGKCYKSYKYCLDDIEKSTLQYDDKQSVTFCKGKSGETDKCKKKYALIDEAKWRKEHEKPLFKYFLDGSRRTYKVDDIAFNNRLYPLIAGQIGVGCCERKNPDSFKSYTFERQFVLAMPDSADTNGKDELFYNSIICKINELEILKRINIKFHKILRYQDRVLKEGEKYEHKGIILIQNEMINNEKIMVKQLANERRLNVNSYLLKDGSLEYSERGAEKDYRLSMIKGNYKYVVGVSKSFNPELFKDNKGKSIAQEIAELKLYHRTTAYRYYTEFVPDVEFAVWYLRIRPNERTISPYDGIIKIEKILLEEDLEKGVNSEEIDRISANLINERNPTCYGSDTRWANHLYPVFLTENFIKSNYISENFFLHLF